MACDVRFASENALSDSRKYCSTHTRLGRRNACPLIGMGRAKEMIMNASPWTPGAPMRSGW